MRPALLLFVFAACAPDLRDDFPLDGALPGADHITHEPQADGSTLSRVDASNKTSFVYFDLDTGKELEASAAVETQAWDLSFQRYKVSSNGGDSGPGKVKVLGLKDVAWATLTVAPKDEYVADTADSVFTRFEGGWYFYDLGKHKLVPRDDLLYVVQSTEGRYFKLQMLGYYDANGTAAKPSLKWAAIADPP
jgi:hypothetical protein